MNGDLDLELGKFAGSNFGLAIATIEFHSFETERIQLFRISC